MSITDPVILVHDQAYAEPWTLHRGRETFYDEGNRQRRWETREGAVAWAQQQGWEPLDEAPEPEAPAPAEQERLF